MRPSLMSTSRCRRCFGDDVDSVGSRNYTIRASHINQILKAYRGVVFLKVKSTKSNVYFSNDISKMIIEQRHTTLYGQVRVRAFLVVEFVSCNKM